MTAPGLNLSGGRLQLAELFSWEASGGPVALTPEAVRRMEQSVGTVRRVVSSGETSYGINTGFGAFANRQISAEQAEQLQYNLVRSHTCGVGPALPDTLVRRIMLLKANSLAVGCSGIRPLVVETLLGLLNAGVVPVIPSQGSVGASGDLAPLAHLALALIGEGEANLGGEPLRNGEVLDAAGLAPVTLQPKEGLALLNGTQVSAALALEGYRLGRLLLETAIVAGSLSVEGLAGSFAPFDPRIHEARGLPGQIRVAEDFRALLTASEINASHKDCDRVQDPYAVRCMPQVFGAVADTLDHAARVLETESNGVSDNPLVFGDEVLSGGNFHAEPVGFVADFMGIAVAELASMSERRIDLLARRVNPKLNLFLAAEPGLESGFMIAHVTSAALASENKTMAHPASVDSIPTSAGQEDHVSMAPWAGRKLLNICDNTATILAIELLAATQAIDAQRPLKTSEPLEAVYERIRAVVPPVSGDRRLDRETGALRNAVLGARFRLESVT
jgi:histidine ammonia-lyase